VLAFALDGRLSLGGQACAGIRACDGHQAASPARTVMAGMSREALMNAESRTPVATAGPAERMAVAAAWRGRAPCCISARSLLMIRMLQSVPARYTFRDLHRVASFYLVRLADRLGDGALGRRAEQRRTLGSGAASHIGV
jgi:hypothetical protein